MHNAVQLYLSYISSQFAVFASSYSFVFFVRSYIVEKLYKCYTSVSCVVPRVLVTANVNGILIVGAADKIMQDL